MSDILLVEGNNQLNVQMTPVGVTPPLEAEFEYASDIRTQSYQRPDYPSWATGISFEVDIKNTGGSPGTCTATAHIETCYGDNPVGIGTQTINPGETVTFSGNWYWPYGPMEADEWWRPGYITSEAGDITFLFGRSLYFVSFDIPPQIASGSEYWATQVVHLPYRNDYIFDVKLMLINTQYPECNTIASQAIIAGSNYVAGEDGIRQALLLDHEGIYTVRGIWTMVVVVPGISSKYANVAAKAYVEYSRYLPPGVTPDKTSTTPHGVSYSYPLPRGIYNVSFDVRHGYIVSSIGEVAGYYPDISQVVGQVEII